MAIEVYCPNCKKKISIDSLKEETYICWWCMTSFDSGSANLVMVSDEDPPDRFLGQGSKRAS